MVRDVATSNTTMVFGGASKSFGGHIRESSELYEILTTKIYTDKILAPVRELLCNAYDAQVASGRADTAIRVTLPLSSDPNPRFEVRDYGAGLTRQEMDEVYSSYCASTKTRTNSAIGCFGLGSKSPLAYTQCCDVYSYQGGKEYRYVIKRNDSYLVDCAEVAVSDTDEPDGLKVSIPVAQKDADRFIERFQYMASAFEGRLEACTSHGDNYLVRTPLPLRKDTAVSMVPDDTLNRYDIPYGTYGKLLIVMGGVIYPYNRPQWRSTGSVDESQFRTLIQPMDIYGYTLVIKVPVGSVDIAVSREAVEDTAKTYNTVMSALAKHREYVLSELQKMLSDNQDTAVQRAIKASRFLGDYPEMQENNPAVNAILCPDISAPACTPCVAVSVAKAKYSTSCRSVNDHLSERQLGKHAKIYTFCTFGSIHSTSTLTLAWEKVADGTIKFFELPAGCVSSRPKQVLRDFAVNNRCVAVQIYSHEYAEKLRKLGFTVATPAEMPKPPKRSCSTVPRKPTVKSNKISRAIRKCRKFSCGSVGYDWTYLTSSYLASDQISTEQALSMSEHMDNVVVVRPASIYADGDFYMGSCGNPEARAVLQSPHFLQSWKDKCTSNAGPCNLTLMQMIRMLSARNYQVLVAWEESAEAVATLKEAGAKTLSQAYDEIAQDMWSKDAVLSAILRMSRPKWVSEYYRVDPDIAKYLKPLAKRKLIKYLDEATESLDLSTDPVSYWVGMFKYFGGPWTVTGSTHRYSHPGVPALDEYQSYSEAWYDAVINKYPLLRPLSIRLGCPHSVNGMFSYLSNIDVCEKSNVVEYLRLKSSTKRSSNKN